eukprot:363324-Chlamydomonas_euryale.AAC.6
MKQEGGRGGGLHGNGSAKNDGGDGRRRCGVKAGLADMGEAQHRPQPTMPPHLSAANHAARPVSN